MQSFSVRKILEATGVPFAVVANLANSEIVCIGDSANVRCFGPDDLFDTFFSDGDTLAALNRTLEGQIMPRIWRQGKVVCVVCKPSQDVIVALFSDEELDPVAEYHWSKKLGKEVAALWTNESA